MNVVRILLAVGLFAPAVDATAVSGARRRTAVVAQRVPRTSARTPSPPATSQAQRSGTENELPCTGQSPPRGCRRPTESQSSVLPSPPPGSPTANPALTAAQIVAGVQDFYNRTNDFEADFEQVSRNRLSGQEQRRSGHVRFRKPGRMRWDYTVPSGDVIVSDGTTLWAYEAAARQAVQSNLQQSQLPSALSFLTGTGRLADDFTFRLLDARRYQWNGYVLELRPIVPNPSFERLVFYIEPAHYQVVKTVVIDAQGNTNSIVFRNPRVNMNHPLEVFQWTPPPGTQIVRP